MLKVAVTGASGHIGNCLVRELVKSGAQVKVLVHRFYNDLAKLDVEIIEGDVLEPETLIEFCKNVEVVFHCAARISIDNLQPEKTYQTNVTGTKNVVEASIAAGVTKFIHFSSIDTFLKIPENQVLDENTPLTDSEKSMYEFSKAESEKIVSDAVKRGLDAVILSPTAVIGPFDYRGSFLGQALIKIYKNKIPMLIPGGYNWVDVRDVVFAAIQSVKSGRKGEKYILSGNYCTLKNLSAMVRHISGKKTSTRLAPVFFAKLACPFFQLFYILTKIKPIYTCHSLNLLIHASKNISLEKSQKELNYFPRTLEDTLKDTFDWYKQNKYLN